MKGFAVDHLVIRAPEPDALATHISQATGLPVLRGWTPQGVMRSRGVRFANGPFLDIFEAQEPRPVHLGLRGDMALAERLAQTRGWRARNPKEDDHFPWRLMTFRRDQGALSTLFVIDYDLTSPAWQTEEFSGELFRPESAGPGAVLKQICLGAPDGAADITELRPAGIEIAVTFSPIAEVLRLEVSGAPFDRDLQITPGLLMRITAA